MEQAAEKQEREADLGCGVIAALLYMTALVMCLWLAMGMVWALKWLGLI